MPEYEARDIKISALVDSELETLSRLYLTYYGGSHRQRFLADLQTKSAIMLIECDGQIVGFSTYKIFDQHWQGTTIGIVFSGDTIVDKAHWGQQALAFNWIRRMGQLKRQQPTEKLYWFLIVKGHRTFRYLDTFSYDYYPHPSRDQPTLRALVEFLADKHFSEYYNPDTGVIEFPPERGYLKPPFSSPTTREANSAAVSLFFSLNPGYQHGHELACLCELTADNLKPLARRIFVGN
jgi:hypothetical protein